MSTSSLVSATQSPYNPPLQETGTGVVGAIAGTGIVPTATVSGDPFVKTIENRRRQLQQLKETTTTTTTTTITKETATISYPILAENTCCTTCYDTVACGDTCISPKEDCGFLTGCACNAVATPGALWTVGPPGAGFEYVLSKQGLAAVRTPPTVNKENGHTSCGCVSLAKPTDCILVMTNLQDLAGKTKTCKEYCKSRSDSNTECGYTRAEYAEELGYRADANGGATTLVMVTDGNPNPADQCGVTEENRIMYIDGIKAATDRLIPVGVGSEVEVGTLMSLSHGMPASMPYITTSFGTLASALDVLVTLSCPTQAPTAPPTNSPTRSPTTAKPTAKPTHSSSCSAEEWKRCDTTNGECVCGDGECSKKECRCKDGFGCSDLACGTCTIAPTLAPTFAPTSKPSKAPTMVPSKAPTDIPTVKPTSSPSAEPTAAPTLAPTTFPTEAPTIAPTVQPSDAPTAIPSASPSAEPTAAPTLAPTTFPTEAPTIAPTVQPSDAPTVIPTASPSAEPTAAPTLAPTSFPTAAPSGVPTESPTVGPTSFPTAAPTAAPSAQPTKLPTTSPTEAPTKAPTFSPTLAPTVIPTMAPVFSSVCSPAEASAAPCDPTLGICSKDAGTGDTQCACSAGYSCDGNGASGCRCVLIPHHIVAPPYRSLLTSPSALHSKRVLQRLHRGADARAYSVSY